MKANQKRVWNQDTRAEVGIGTMIVFIATILVAATAAAVLIDTGGKLQERSASTGNEATKQVASNLIVKSITGERFDTDNDVDWLNLTVGLAPGAKNVDMTQLKIQVGNGDVIRTYDFNAAESTANNVFQLEFERDLDTSANVMTYGDLVDIKIDLLDRTFSFAERTDVHISLIPEIGSQVDSSFTTPPSFGTDLYLVLR